MSERFLLGAVALAGLITSVAFAAPSAPELPPGEDAAKATLDKSPRHHEWVDVGVSGSDAMVATFVAYPERADKAPVVIVIHEIFGCTDWARGVADRLAGEGFLAVIPDLLSGKGPKGGGTDSFASGDDAIRAVRGLAPDEVTKRLDAVSHWASTQPSATGKFATVGFCWGGSQSFRYAATQPALGAAVVFYGTAPDSGMASIHAPVLGFYGGDDARVTSTVDSTAAEMKRLGKSYESHVYAGAGHGFMRAQDGRDGANRKAATEAWPAAIAFLKKQLS